jgi:hypothetical protein
MQVSADTIKKAHAIAFKIRATNEAVTELALFAALQVNSDASPVSHLARWLIDRIIPMFDRVHSAARRSRLARDFRAKATVGDLNALLGALLDPKERRADDKEYGAALYRYRELGMQLLWLRQAPGQRRLVAATALGHRIATGIGVVTLVGATLVSLFGRVP